MKRSIHFFLITTCCLLATVLLGCATIKEAAKGFAGVSTRILEEGRKDAAKKSFAVGYDSCYAKVKDILKEKTKDALKGEEVGPYIYAEDVKNKMIAIYVSDTDTTPVGIFFAEEAKGQTLIEVSSPSTYAKELIAHKIFTGIETAFKLKIEPEGQGLPFVKQSHKEKESNVKK